MTKITALGSPRKPARLPLGDATTRILCWIPLVPGVPPVALVEFPDTARRSDAWANTSLAGFDLVHRMTPGDRQRLVFMEAMHLIIRDDMDPLDVHHALLGLVEYRAGLADDVPGLPPRRAS